MLSAIIVGPNREMVHWLTAACAEMGNLCIYKTLTAYPQPYELIKLLDIFNPEVVFLEIEDRADSPTVIARQIRTGYPKTAIIGFAQQLDPEKRREVLEAGVNEVLAPPFQGVEFMQAVVRAVAAQAATVTENIIAFQPGKAGSGASTLAVQSAALLAQEWQKKVLVVEGDFGSGALAAQQGLEVEPERSIVKALEESQFLDDRKWAALIYKAHDFDLLPMPTIKADAEVSQWEYRRVLTYARSRYEVIVVDLPEIPGPATEAIVGQAKSIYLVTTPDKIGRASCRERV